MNAAECRLNKAWQWTLCGERNQKSTFNNNGSLVHTLESFNMKKHFIALIQIICEQEYEARLIAYGIVQNLSPSISNKTKENAIKILEKYQVQFRNKEIYRGENSALHFVEKTKEILTH